MTENEKPTKRRRRLSAPFAALALVGSLLAAPTAQAGFVNGGFEDGNLTGWTTKRYERGSTTGSNSNAGLDVFPPTKFDELKLFQVGGEIIGGSASDHSSHAVFLRTGATETLLDNTACSTEYCNPSTGSNSAPNLKLPRWGENAVRVGGYGGYNASSIEQTAVMTVADVDPVDGKIHVRFALAPILNDPNHSKERQPYFFVEVVNETKGTQLFNTFNFSNQSGIPWQKNGNYGYTDWQGFDVSPGNGLLDVGDSVTLRVYVANCADGGQNHTAVVYLDAVGAFMPGLSVQATGPSTTQPGADITYTYNYTNGSGVYAMGSEVQITAPFTADGEPLTFVDGDIPANCSNPPVDHDPASRGKYVTCDVGDLANNQGGSLDVKFKVPSNASTTTPDNVINNGDYNIYANAVSPYLGPLVKTNIVAGDTNLVDLGVTIDNGGVPSYSDSGTANYTVKVKNHGSNAAEGTVTQTITGLGDACANLTINPAAPAVECESVTGTGVKLTFPTGNLAPGAEKSYTVSGPVTGPSNVVTVATVAATSGTDSNASNNTDGINTPVSANQHNLTVNATGTGTGRVNAVPSGLSCASPCSSTGVTKPMGAGQEAYLTPVADSGSVFKGWETGSCTDVLANDVCYVKMGDANQTATAIFAKLYTVTPEVVGGTSGPDTPQLIEHGEDGSFTITPNVPGHVPVVTGTCPNASLTPVPPPPTSSYTFEVSDVEADCDFKIEFVGPHITTVVTPPNGPLVPGETVTTTVTCISDGAVAAEQVSCSMTPPGNVTGWNQVSCTPNQPVTLPVGQSAQCTYEFEVPTDGPVTLTGNGVCTNDCQDDDEKSVKLPHTPVPGEPHITTVVTPPPGPLVPGEEMNITITCLSDGAVTANGVTCELDVPPSMEEWQTDKVCTPPNQPVNLPVGQSAQCTYTFLVPPTLPPTVPTELTGTGKCTNAPAGGVCEDDDKVPLTPSSKVPGEPHITTVVTPPPSPVPGQTVTTTVTCTSDGDVAAPNATCAMVPPTGVENWTAKGCVPAVPVNPLAVNDSIVCTYEFTVPPVGVTDIPLRGVGNCAAGSCGSQDEKHITPRAAGQVAPVPVDNPIALLLLALGMMGFMARRHSRRA